MIKLGILLKDDEENKDDEGDKGKGKVFEDFTDKCLLLMDCHLLICCGLSFVTPIALGESIFMPCDRLIFEVYVFSS